MKYLVSAIALVIASPALAQTTPAPPPADHGQHQQHGQTHGQHGQGHGQHGAGHGQHQQPGHHQPGEEGEQRACCADRNGNGRMDCCEQEEGEAAGCCREAQAESGGHESH